MKLFTASILAVAVFVCASLWIDDGRPMAAERFTSESTDSMEGASGVLSVKSANSFYLTWTKLNDAIKSNAALKIVAIIDHAANAKRSGQELRPTSLVIFGNPGMGTPLMQASQTAALDLPQKMIVYQNEKGEVYVAYNDPAFISERHSIAKDHPAVKAAVTGLANLAKAATTK